MKKFFKKLCLTIFLFVALVLLFNISDSDLKPETQEVLQTSLTSTEQEEKQCARILGLFVDKNLDFEEEGQKLFSQIHATPIESIMGKNIVTIPTIGNAIQEKEKCKGLCKYSKEEKERLKNELAKQTVFLTRFKKVLEGNTFSCHPPLVLFRFHILGLFYISRQQIMEYNILAQEGKIKDAQEGLIKMNAFFENTLLKENKYTLVDSLIFVKTLNNTREVLSDLPTFNHATVRFKAISYEDVIKRAEIGELQAEHTLLNVPMTRKFFEQATISDTPEVKKPSPLAQYLDGVINKVLNYFFLKNETLNDNLQVLKIAAWHPCIGQDDIPCDSKSPNPFSWLRNPMGKMITYVISSNTPSTFRKLKNNINELTITTYNSALHKK